MQFNIALLGGDGIGPEVVEQGVKVMNAVGKRFGHQFNFQPALIGAAAIDATGKALPDETLDVCIKSQAVLFGAIGHPKYDNDPKAKVRPEHGLLAMRKQLGLYANIRPVETFNQLLDKSPLKNSVIEGADFVVIRELTGGIYFGEPRGRSENGETAFDTCLYSRYEVERVVRLAFDYAAQRRKKLCVVDKANVLATSRLWRETTQQLAPQYPNIEVSYMFVDNAAMQLILNPRQFDVIVTENMFGDILTDEASVITGSMGLLPSASIGLKTSVFEPIHGSYPQAAGKNIANPLATVLSVAMMFDYSLGLHKEAALVREAVNKSIEALVVTQDLNADKPYSTTEVGDWLRQYIAG